jgi:hypothetical protein
MQGRKELVNNSLPEELTMKNKAKEIGAMVKETVQTAQKQWVELEGDVHKFVGRVQEKVMAGPTDSIKKMDDLLRAMAVTDFVEKIRAIEMFKQSNALKQDLLDRFGLASIEEVDKLRKEVTTLKSRVTKLSKRPNGPSTTAFNTLKKRVDELSTGR